MTFEISRRGALALAAGSTLLGSRTGSVNWSRSFVDALIERFRARFEVPGFAVAIVRAGAPPFVKGYGVRNLGRPVPVDADSLFAIASNTKSFTAAAIAILVERGKLVWDDPVIRYLPEFAMSDPEVTKLMTVRDLLCHRSGLALGAGDLMQFPKSDRTAEELFQALPHLPLVRGFRSGYAYDNILYVVAGILISRVSGMSWEDFVTHNILRPLRMMNSVAGLALVRTTNVVGRHARLGPPLPGLGPIVAVNPNESPVVNAAGGIHASVNDIVPWLQTQLGKGRTVGKPRLWTEAQSDEMWRPEVIAASTTGPDEANPVRPVLRAYALGWYVQEYRGHRLISHAGGLAGQITHTALLPEQGIGLALYSNTEDQIPVGMLRYALLDHLLGVVGTDWLDLARAEIGRSEAAARALVTKGEIPRPVGGPSLPLAAYAGRYRDPWYGDILITVKEGRLAIDFTRTPAFKGALEPWGVDTFRTRWPAGAGEDAVITFQVADGRASKMRLKALSPLADFSYDFQDLAPARVN